MKGPIRMETRGSRVFYPLTSTDGYMPMLAISYNVIPRDEEDPNVRLAAATVAIDADGASSAPTIVISIARNNASGTGLTALTYTLSGGATSTYTWAGSSPTFTRTAADLKAAVDALNAVPGIVAYAMHAPYDASLNSTAFIDQGVSGSSTTLYKSEINGAIGESVAASTSAIPIIGGRDFTQILYRDVSAYRHTLANANTSEVAWMRVGNPEFRDEFHLNVHRLYGQATFASGNGLVRIYRDGIDDYGKGEVEMFRKALTSATDTALIDLDKLKPESFRCPFIVEVVAVTNATDVTAIDMTLNSVQP